MFLGSTLLEPGRGGISAVARMTARALLDAGYDLELLSLLDESPITIGGRTAATTRGNRLAYFLRCHAAALRHKWAIYDSVGMARAHPRVARKHRPYIVWMHGIEVWYHLNKERERALRGAELVLVNSQFTLDRFQGLHFPLENAEVCHLATEQDEPPTEFPDFQGPPTVLILGRLDKEPSYKKGHRELIECWPEVVRAVPDARLVIAGGGEALPMTRELVHQSPASGNIDVLGFVPNEDLPALWRRAHVFAMPSRKEGFGIVYAEAMRHGLPVIASVHDAGQEVNQHGVTGFNVDLDKQENLPHKIIELLRHPDLCVRLGRQGAERWKSHYRYSAFQSRIENKLRDLIKK